jgi:hypothetical protein
MGISIETLQFLLHEHRYKPITGDLLTIGKQAIPIPPETLISLIEQYGLPVRSREFAFDTANQHGGQSKLISDKSFFASFSDCRVWSADISDYECADHIFDICGKVPRRLRGRFQFVIDGGSLDNVFDPFRMLSNMTEMLAPGGRMLLYAWSNSHPTAYAKVTPDWLMDYFAVNEFADCKVYPVEYPHLRRSPQDGPLFITAYHYDPYVIYSGQAGYECSSIFSELPLQTHCIAEKGTNSTSQRTAVQKHYRGAAIEPYLGAAHRFRSSPRPLFESPISIDFSGRSISDYDTVKSVARWG